jgi:hypothetical protein
LGNAKEWKEITINDFYWWMKYPQRGELVCGDFIVVRSYAERKISAIGPSYEDFTHFNHFINDKFLFDLPLCGRSFTWFRGDGSSMSRLDRFLLLEEWCVR